MDPYSTLGVAVNATQDEIKKAYRSLVREWHPDYNSSPEASAKFDAIQQAYDSLTRTTGFKPTSFPHFTPSSTPGWQRPTPQHSAAPSERMKKVVQASARKKSDTEQATTEHKANRKRISDDLSREQQRMREALDEERLTARRLIDEARDTANVRIDEAGGNHHRIVAIAAEREQLIRRISTDSNRKVTDLAQERFTIEGLHRAMLIEEDSRFQTRLVAIDSQFLQDSGVIH